MFNIEDNVYVKSRYTNEAFDATIVSKKHMGFWRETIYIVKTYHGLRSFPESRVFTKEVKQ